MDSQARPSPASTALLTTLTCVPLFLSVLSFFPELFTARPVQHFFLGLAPWWLAYLSARWYIRLAEQPSPLYHPLGCIAQCFVWVFHWSVSLYHAFFVTKYTMWTYLVTMFCAGIVVITEGLFHSLIMMGSLDTTRLGVYEKVRRAYGQGLIMFIGVWYLVDAETHHQQHWNRARVPMHSRSMTI